MDEEAEVEEDGVLVATELATREVDKAVEDVFDWEEKLLVVEAEVDVAVDDVELCWTEGVEEERELLEELPELVGLL